MYIYIKDYCYIIINALNIILEKTWNQLLFKIKFYNINFSISIYSIVILICIFLNFNLNIYIYMYKIYLYI